MLQGALNPRNNNNLTQGVSALLQKKSDRRDSGYGILLRGEYAQHSSQITSEKEHGGKSVYYSQFFDYHDSICLIQWSCLFPVHRIYQVWTICQIDKFPCI